MPPHPFELSREALLAALINCASVDPRIEALWLQGSLATGDSDPFSDIDAYLAIRDGDYDAVWEDRGGVLTRLGVPYPIDEASERAMRELIETSRPPS